MVNFMIQKVILEEIIISQRANLSKSEIGILRDKEKDIKIIDSFAVIITGIRRCGKSTIMHHLLRKQKLWYYLNLEDPRLEGFDLQDFNRVESIMKELYGNGGVYFFDEIQNIEKWEKFIRYILDKKEKVVITCSNASLLSEELGTKLTGRHIQLELFPFSYKEFLKLKKEDKSIKSFEEYLFKGGFPEYLKKDYPPILNELLSDVVTKDVGIRFGIRNIAMLNKLAIYLISNIGKEFSYNSIKNMLKIKSVQTIIDYVNHLENSYLLFTVPRFSYSYRQQLINPKKVYSIDNGFSVNNSVTFSKDKGKMLENCIFLELRRNFKDIFYFQEVYECDFLIKEKEKIVKAIQVCYEINEENKDREINGLMTALKKFNLNDGIILSFNQDDEFLIEGKKIKIKPAMEWLLDFK